MYTRKKYSFQDLIMWTRWEILAFTLIAIVVTCLYEVAGLRWLQLPWTPIALIGTAVAFLIGFQNSAAYDRTWEARKIWGGIVNTSRSFAIMVNDMVTNEFATEPLTEDELHQERTVLIYRHIAWLTAMRYALRQSRPWEVFLEHRTNKEWNEKLYIPERDQVMDDELKPLLAEKERHEIAKKTNIATAILAMQSRHLRELKERELIWNFSFLEMESVVRVMFDLQGKSERIKNFPYPRQYATLSYDIVRIFVLLLPFGVIPEFAAIGKTLSLSFPLIGSYFVWASVPFAVTVSWVFQTMQRIGTVGENPFEGSANDVPISTIARAIEIDLREMLDEAPDNIPKPLPSSYHIQM